MLFTPDELIKSHGLPITVLQLAYLVKANVIKGPVSLPTEPPRYFFDSELEREIRELIGCECPQPAQRNSSESPTEDTAHEEFYSEDARRLLKERPNIALLEALRKDNHKIDVDDFLADFFKKRPKEWYRRLWRYLTKSRPVRIKVTDDEQGEFGATFAVQMVNLNSRVVFSVAPRLRHFDLSKPFDRCFQKYIQMNEIIGWGRFDNELAVIEALLREDPELKRLPIKEGLQHIRDLEGSYKELQDQTMDYLEKVDPENLIFRRLFHDLMSPTIIKITLKKDIEELKNILKDPEKGNENVRPLSSGIRITENIISESIKKFLS